MCLNWKVLGSVILIIILTYAFLPKIAAAAPLLLVLVCPLSMMLMMRGIHRNHQQMKDKDSDKQSGA